MYVKDIISSIIPKLQGYQTENLDTLIHDTIDLYKSKESEIIGMFLYNRGDYKEIKLVTSPERHIPYIRINKV